MTRKLPTVMVSSTCFDLKHMRNDLFVFLKEQLGYNVLLSEHPSFPVDPSAAAVENCVNRAKEDCDLLVLVIGTRLGSLEAKSGKSITNLEYIAAKANGVPIFAFVDKRLPAWIEIWKNNPNGSYEGVVDNPKLFEFVEAVKSVDSVWIFEYETPAEIISTLRHQLGFLQYDGLALARRLRGNPNLFNIPFSGESLRIALEKPSGWEYKLFRCLLDSEIHSARELKEDLRYQIVLGTGDYIAREGLHDWFKARLGALNRIMDAFKALLGGAFAEAVGPPGAPGDVWKIYFVTKRIGETYREAIRWSFSVLRDVTEEEFMPLVKIFSTFSEGFISELERCAKHIGDGMDKALADPSGGPHSIEVVFTPTISNSEKFAECARSLDFGSF